jgi:hypothetical protein
MEEQMKQRFYIAIVITLIFISAVNSQITITSSEWPSAFGSQWGLYVTEDTIGLGLPVNLGSTGGPQTWTFSQALFPVGEVVTATIVDPTTTPYTATFPNADHVWQVVGMSGGVPMNSYSYLQLTSMAWLSLGYAATFGTSSILEDNVPDDLILEFPATLGTSWTSNYTVTTTPFPGTTQFDSTSRSSTIDAWGTVQLPIDSFDCLRIRDDEISYYNFYVGGVLQSSDTIISYTYTWITEQEGLLAEVQSLEDEPNPNFTLAEEVTFRTTPITGLSDNNTFLINEYVLSQNYPNPFNPTTRIEYSISKSTELEISVFNLLGQKIKVLFSGMQEAGNHSVEFNGENLPSGIYLYQLKSAEFEDYKKCILLK